MTDKPVSTIKPEDIPPNKVIDYDSLVEQNKLMKEWLQFFYVEAMKAHNDSELAVDFPAYAATMISRCQNELKQIEEKRNEN